MMQSREEGTQAEVTQAEVTDAGIEQVLALAHSYADAKLMRYGALGIKEPPDPAAAFSELRRAILALRPERVVDVRCEGCGYMTHHREHMGCVRSAKQHTHPAPSVPSDVVRDAERYRFIRDADVSDDLIPDIALYAMESLDEYIDAAMLAASNA